MARRIGMETRAELIAVLGDRYREAGRRERVGILDAFVAASGYHRKHAARLLRTATTHPATARAARRRVYGDAVREALVVAWEASDRICGKRLKPLLPVLLPSLERHGRVVVDDEVRALLLAASAAKIDRLLAEVRRVARGGTARRAGFASAVRRSVPIRTSQDWDDPPPGFVEVDFVAHSGPSSAGSFVQTLVLTDVATGWTEFVAVPVRESGLVVEALARALRLFPFPLRGVDFDDDSAFMNETALAWCRDRGLVVTRSRAYRKNDQAHVEQKNGAIVRRLVGYGRFEGLLATGTLSRLYAAVRIHANLFQPSSELRTKTRIGARVVKRYHAPEPPAARLLAHAGCTEATGAAVRALMATNDPVIAIAEIRAAQEELGRRLGRGGRTDERGAVVPSDPAAFAASAREAWRQGERRPTHRRPYRRREPVPTRPSMMDRVEAMVRGWMEERPGIGADEVVCRLMALDSGRFRQSHLRTVQRALRRWRGDQARRLLAGSPPRPRASALRHDESR